LKRSKTNIFVFRDLPSCSRKESRMIRLLSRRLSVESRLEKLKGGSVDFQTKNKIGFIRINNPDKFNALTGSMMLDFSKVMEEVENFDGTAIILTGEGKAFCSGSDLRNGFIQAKAAYFLEFEDY